MVRKKLKKSFWCSKRSQSVPLKNKDIKSKLLNRVCFSICPIKGWRDVTVLSLISLSKLPHHSPKIYAEDRKKLLWRKQLLVAQLSSIKSPSRQASDYYKGFTAPTTGAKTQKWGEESTETKAWTTGDQWAQIQKENLFSRNMAE